MEIADIFDSRENDSDGSEEELLLEIELIPKSSWWRNCRSRIDDWDEIRKFVYRRADYECEVCGGTGEEHPVEAHEKWDYDWEGKRQILAEIKALCPLCHLAAHPGYANTQGRYSEAVTQFRKVNNLSRKKAGKIITMEMKLWKKRSKVDWELDLSFLSPIREEIS